MEEVVQVKKVHRGDGPAAANKQQPISAAGEIRIRQRNIADPDPEPGEDEIHVVLPGRRLRRQHKPERTRRRKQHVEGVLVRGQLVGLGC